jgi:tetraprenyl-beta-curcumene synthase
VDEVLADEIHRAYFPWVGGLHILLDYLIDQQEDLLHGDLNFVSFYSDATQIAQRLSKFVRESLRHTRKLTDGRRIHQDTVRGVLAVYLSDAKVSAQPQIRRNRRLIWQFGPTTLLYYAACRHYRASFVKPL